MSSPPPPTWYIRSAGPRPTRSSDSPSRPFSFTPTKLHFATRNTATHSTPHTAVNWRQAFDASYPSRTGEQWVVAVAPLAFHGNPEVVHEALRLLANIARLEEPQNAIVALSVVGAAVNLLTHPEPAVVGAALGLLVNMVTTDDGREAALKEDVFPRLLCVLDAAGGDFVHLSVLVCQVFVNLCRGEHTTPISSAWATSLEALRMHGGLDRLPTCCARSLS
mmetsp:Transcript_1173/g.2337  ORF Transcript_1173/g.2337 Transcript_1173/m.2337 type:complete len:221 (+) Transcript_1173:1028-1690(+)